LRVVTRHHPRVSMRAMEIKIRVRKPIARARR
jgi:hypothetical protein